MKVINIFLAISLKCINFKTVFSLDFISELLKYSKINNYIINLINSQQLPYKSINSLETIKLRVLKRDIKSNLANGFIELAKSSTNTLIFYVQNLIGNFCLYINYQSLKTLPLKIVI